MALDMSITYKDPSRAQYWFPFSFQSTLREHWWPLAEKHGLETLQRLECLFIEDRTEAEQLLREFRYVENLLKSADRGGVRQSTSEHMLERLAILLPALEAAIAEWENVEQISI